MSSRLSLVVVLIFLLCSNILKFTTSEELCSNKDRTILELQLENTRIKLENLSLREQNERLSKDRINCTALVDEAVYITEILKRIQGDVEPFKNFVQSKFGKQTNTTDTVRNELSELSENVAEILKIVKQNEAVKNNSTVVAEQNEVHSVKMPKNCAEAADGKVGVFRIQLPNSTLEPFETTCDNDNWMIILRRIDGSVDFYRNWREYREGFGNASGEYFIGLEKLHQLTSRECHELKIELEDFGNERKFAKYKQFEIGNEDELYKLKTLGEYYGNAGDALKFSKSAFFSTYDRDNDGNSLQNCAEKYKGAWWHDGCYYSQLTGAYHAGGADPEVNGIKWITWSWMHSLKTAKIKIRPC